LIFLPGRRQRLVLEVEHQQQLPSYKGNSLEDILKFYEYSTLTVEEQNKLEKLLVVPRVAPQAVGAHVKYNFNFRSSVAVFERMRTPLAKEMVRDPWRGGEDARLNLHCCWLLVRGACWLR